MLTEFLGRMKLCNFRGSTSVDGLGQFTSSAEGAGLGQGSVQFSMNAVQIKETIGLKPVDLSRVSIDTSALNRAGFHQVNPNLGLASQFYAPARTNLWGGFDRNQIGDRRLQFSATSADFISALGMQVPGSVPIPGGRDLARVGLLAPYKSGGLTFPPCGTRSTSTFRAMMISTADLFKALDSEASALTIVFRILLFILLFVAYNLIGGPLSVAPDIIPCIGPFFSGIVGCVVGIMAFFLALSTWTTATALSWIFYRPLLGIGLLVVAGVAFAAVMFVRGRGNSKGAPLQ